MNLQKLRSTRGGIQRTITIFLEKIEEKKESGTLVEVNSLLKTLETKVEMLESINEKIISQTEVEGIEDEIVETDTYMMDIHMKLDTLRAERDHRDTSFGSRQTTFHPVDTPPTTLENRNTHAIQNPVDTIHLSGMNSSQFHRLPKLSLPMFNGDILQWQSFWDSFESSVHLNLNLSEVQKFNYLKSQLEGNAARTIDGFTLTNANYAQAIELLRERYGKTHKIIHAYMQALLETPSPSNNLHSLRLFQDKMEAYIRGLESLGQGQDTYGTLLVPVIIGKLPTEIRRNLARDHGDDNWILRDLRRAICKEINIIEAGMPQGHGEIHSFDATASFFTGAKSKKMRGNQIFSTSIHSSRERKDEVKCIFCDGSHSNTDCKKITSVDERRKIVKEKKRCFNCLRTHFVAQCNSNGRCRKCQRKHHTSICDRKFHPTPCNSTSGTTSHDASVLYTTTKQIQTGVLLKTAQSTVSSGFNNAEANILFDEGAQRSFMTKELADKLNIVPDSTEEMSLSSFGSKTNQVQHLDNATIYLHTEEGKKIPIRVLIVPMIATPMNNRLRKATSSLPYLRGLKLAHPITDDCNFEISVLIGADYYWKIIEDEIIRGDGPTAVKSKIGYLLSGPLQCTYPTRPTNTVLNVIIPQSHKSEEIAIERFWKLESIGINADEKDDTAMEYLQNYQDKSISFSNGKYCAQLPWKQEHPPLPSNYFVTKRRTESTIKRLRTDTFILQKYGHIIEEQEKRGFIEKVTDESQPTHQVHYIPHHGVKKDSLTTPIRIVYDCSCRQTRDSPSLNDCLESVPPILNDLTAILLRFRTHQYAVVTDIEKAFLNVRLHEKDRDSTRFFWLSNPNDPDSPLITYRFKAVLFGATCSPFILNAVLLKHLQMNCHVNAADTLKRDLYVDNVLSSFEHENSVLTYFREARDLMNLAGFNLRSWMSNSRRLREVAEAEGCLDNEKVTKVLGMRWHVSTDDLSFTSRDIPTLVNATKRSILKHSSRIYDPLGILSPVSVRAKILMQEIWKEKIDWDIPIPSYLQEKWLSLAEDLNKVTRISISRRYFQQADDKLTSPHEADKNPIMHIFVDASIQAYGAVAYLCKGKESSLVMAKNRVTPLKKLTLPQLELMAALIGARLASHLQGILSTKNVTFWSDSQIVLYWLKTNKPLKRFISNRVKEIRELSATYNWRYCPTNDNPADLLTRGISASQFIDNTLWNRGPTWITDVQNWPKWDQQEQANILVHEQATTVEQTTHEQTTHETVAVTMTLNSPQHGLHLVIDVNRYNSYNKLLRVHAYVLRFISNCKSIKTQRYKESLTVSELRVAEMKLIQNCQVITFHEEISNIRSLSTRLTLVKQLRLFLDENGSVRCGGRIHNAPLNDQAKFPLLLPRRHHVTRLIVQHVHESQHHAGVNATVTHLRQKFWIPAIRQCVKSVLAKCVICLKTSGKSYGTPDPPPLPKIRVQDATPFTVTGVDFTGALFVKEKSGSESKVYICLFTCACTRAVHLEVVPNLSEESFLNAFRRFSSRKSMPTTMISDNATTYMAAASHLKRLFESPSLQETLRNQGTEWRFIPKRAPWYGGWWERLIGLTKTSLKKTLGRAYVTLESLQTIVTEIEATMNDRPITHVSTNIGDPEPLTPAHLLYGRRITTLPYPDNPDDSSMIPNLVNSQMTKRAKLQAHIITQFQKRWKFEYLTGLREYHKTTGNNTQSIRVGDVVQIKDDCPRIRWKLAVVEELITGNDGLTRAAKIRTCNGHTTRPIVKLYPLEVLCENETGSKK